MHADATDSEKAFYEEEFKKINNAHEILSNAAKRAEYDRELAKKEGLNYLLHFVNTKILFKKPNIPITIQFMLSKIVKSMAFSGKNLQM